jgi:hypothetical protein
MAETVRTSETSVYLNESTWRYIQEGFNVRTSLAGEKMIHALVCKRIVEPDVVSKTQS